MAKSKISSQLIDPPAVATIKFVSKGDNNKREKTKQIRTHKNSAKPQQQHEKATASHTTTTAAAAINTDKSLKSKSLGVGNGSNVANVMKSLDVSASDGNNSSTSLKKNPTTTTTENCGSCASSPVVSRRSTRRKDK